MSGNKEQFTVEMLQKILQVRWPEIIVIGNQPYFDKTVIMKHEGDVYTILQVFESNYKAFQAIVTEGWEPEKPLPDPLVANFFEPKPINGSTRPLLYKLIEILKSADDLGQYFGIRVERELEIVRALFNKQPK